jgi:hypothetical protein
MNLSRKIAAAESRLSWLLQVGRRLEAREVGRLVIALKAQRSLERELAEIDRKAAAGEFCPLEG